MRPIQRGEQAGLRRAPLASLVVCRRVDHAGSGCTSACPGFPGAPGLPGPPGAPGLPWGALTPSPPRWPPAPAEPGSPPAPPLHLRPRARNHPRSYRPPGSCRAGKYRRRRRPCPRRRRGHRCRRRRHARHPPDPRNHSRFRRARRVRSYGNLDISATILRKSDPSVVHPIDPSLLIGRRFGRAVFEFESGQ